MEKILISGFEPFGGRKINSSWDAVSRLPECIGGREVRLLRLPVVYGLAAAELIKTAEEWGADVVLAVGEAGGRQTLTAEQLGVNLRRARIGDNAGSSPVDDAIAEDGADAYFSTVPVRECVERMKAEGIPIEISYSAGTFVCNDVLYSLLYRFKGSAVRCAFLHVPSDADSEEQAAYIKRFAELI